MTARSGSSSHVTASTHGSSSHARPGTAQSQPHRSNGTASKRRLSASSYPYASLSTFAPALQPERRPSPLIKQMSLSSDPPHPSMDVGALRSRAGGGGPLSVLYSVPPEHASDNPGPSARSNLIDIRHSPRRDRFNDASTGDSLPRSPSRSLLAAFQAISPAATSGTGTRAPANPTHSLLAGGGAGVGLRAAGVSTSLGLQPASPIGSRSPTRPPSSSLGRSPVRNAAGASIDWGSDAMRLANGVNVNINVSPSRPSPSAVNALGASPSRSASGSRIPTRRMPTSPSPRVRPAEHVRVASATTPRPSENDDKPTWTIYRDPVPGASASNNGASTSAALGRSPSSNGQNTTLETDTNMGDVDRSDDENEDTEEIDENAAPGLDQVDSTLINVTNQLVQPRSRSMSSSSQRPAGTAPADRRSNLGRVLQPRDDLVAIAGEADASAELDDAASSRRGMQGNRARMQTPPPAGVLPASRLGSSGATATATQAADVFGTPVKGGTPASVGQQTRRQAKQEAEQGYVPDADGSESERRKRRRVSKPEDDTASEQLHIVAEVDVD